ncbi:MAG: twin-arginine translocation signal domain-containing protein [Verrucomicrobiota bacterium]
MIPNPAGQHGETRRQFIKRTGTVAAAVAGASLFNLPALACDQNSPVAIVLGDDPVSSEAVVSWAAEQLCNAFKARGLVPQMYARPEQVPPSVECIMATANLPDLFRHCAEAQEKSSQISPESLFISRGRTELKSLTSRQFVVAAGSDARGLSYALLELADRVAYANDPLAMLESIAQHTTMERPANTIRSVARAFVSEVEDKSWFQDRTFWSRYFSMLAAQRFNRFHLMLGVGYDFTSNITDCYFHFAYPFLLTVPGYNIRAVPLPEAERDSNLQLLRFISDEAARRGLHFQLGLWTHAYRWTNSPNANYVIAGLTPETHAEYCRDALRALLTQCPNIKGVTFRIHGESGVPEGNYDFWKTIFDGVAQCGRRVEIDMHAKGMDQGMIDVALGTGMPVNISPKFWAEHMGLPYMQGAIRPQEMPRNNHSTGFFSRSSGTRSFLRYGYGDLLAEGRQYGVLHRLWPGTQRLLAWGDPETASAYGRVASFCGSAGLELMEPLTFKGRKGSGLPGGRDAYADASLKPANDFEKYLYYYRVWGRNLYQPDGDRDGRRRFLEQRFGRGAGAVEAALSSAGKILPLVLTAHCPSAANNNYWPEMYWNMPIVDESRRHPYSDTPNPKRLGTVSPLDPEFFLGMDEFADELLNGACGGKYSPAWVAAQLDDAAAQAAKCLRTARSKTRDTRSAEFRRHAVDVTTQAGLGKFFAAKFRAGVLYAIYVRTNHRDALKKAIAANRAARAAWAELAKTAKGVYRNDITFGPEYFQRGHWLDRMPAMDADIADMEGLLAEHNPTAPVHTNLEPRVIELAMRAVFSAPEPQKSGPSPIEHAPPVSFRHGQPLEITAGGLLPAISGMDLRYRHVNQSENWQTVAMQRNLRTFRATIPAEYTDSSFPLQYYFRAHSGNQTSLHPGLQPGWNGQPYFVVRQSG